MQLRVAAVLCVMLLGACRLHADLGGEKAKPAAACTEECVPMDASTPSASDAGPTRPDPLFDGEPASEEMVSAFVASLEGVWYGLYTNVGASGDEIGPPFEITFTAGSEVGTGSFSLQCSTDARCDLFGAPTAGLEVGSFSLVNLSTGKRPKATGEFSWEQDFRGTTHAPFWELKRGRDANGPVVTFDLGFANAGPSVLVARRVVLSKVQWPDAGAQGTRDAAVMDGSARDAAPAEGAP